LCIHEAWKAVSAKVGREIQKPLLMGLSAGGVGACRVFSGWPEGFHGMVCMAAMIPVDALPGLNQNIAHLPPHQKIPAELPCALKRRPPYTPLSFVIHPAILRHPSGYNLIRMKIRARGPAA